MRVRTVSSLSSGRRLNSVDAAFVAGARNLGLLVPVVIALTAAGAGEAAGDTIDQGVLVDFEFDDMMELAAPLGEQRVQAFRLRRRAGIAIEDDAGLGGEAGRAPRR